MDNIPGADGAAVPQTGPGPLIQDVETAGFMTEVIEASQTIPVIVDFWAPWCGPCKQLGPTLEKLVTEAGGKVRLAKVNIDQNQQLAQQLRVQSVPMVYAFFGGRPLDGFQGAVPESEVKAFIDRVIEAASSMGGGVDAQGTPVAQLIADGKAALAKDDHGTAMQIFAKVLEAEEQNVAALAGLAKCYLASGEAEAARNLIDSVPEEKRDDADVSAVRSALDLAAETEAAGADAAATAELASKVDANPADHEARFDLAMALFAGGDRQGAVDALLEIVRRNPGWDEGAARKQLIKMFEAWGPEDPLTVEGRERLSTLLFS